MSYNPRQKKRNAQFRKKRFETKGRGGKREDQKEDVGAAAPGELTAARQPEEEKNTVKKQSQDTPTEKKHETAKYSRRKVSSNWERYDCVDAEEDVHSIEREEELQQRLLQLLRLPSVPQDSRTDTATLSQEENDGSFLSLNLKELAESLATLPITERIALPQDLLEHYGVEDVLTTDERNSRTFSTPVDPITAPNSNPPPSTKSNTTSALGSVTALLSKEKESQTRTFDFGAPTARVEPPQTTVSQPESAPTVLEQGMRSYDHSKPQHVDSSGIDQEERQLEVLLHATSGLVHAHDSRTVYEQSTHVSDVEKKMGKEQTREFDDEKIVRGQKCLESKDVTTTAELDDMLDDLLA